ncbi:MAG: sugar ABC transporter ATP-binding protein [Spirochaetales bacterium]|nr:sugar ABC transporter ATP-binding protein [Spirochaetales bacterium]
MSETVIELKGIKKEFPGVLALDKVQLKVGKGEVHALVGENGAGKSTLMNILSGTYQPNEGEILYKGASVRFPEPRDAQDAGIAMIHQELSLSPSLSIYENIFVGRLLKNRFGLTDIAAMIRDSSVFLEELGMGTLDPKTLISDLSVSQQQLVEIAKAVSLNSDIIIMDEPTSSLTRKESLYLFKIIEGLKAKGVSVLFISHRMDEIFSISDKITVLRDGRYIDTLDTGITNEKEIVSLMVGRSLDKQFHREKKKEFSGNPLLEVKDLSVPGLFENVNFKLYSGMILGLTGLVGAGRSELVQSIFGADNLPDGEILIQGDPAQIKNVKDSVGLGLGLIPEGRKTQGIFREMSVRENISMTVLQKEPGQFLIDRARESEDVEEYIRKLRIKTPGPEQKIKFLSGGNQQKAILARWLLSSPRILILDEPTHGIDVGAKAEIYQLMEDLTREGIGILLISSELPEIITMSDEILVMSEGRINGSLPGDSASQDEIMQLSIPGKERSKA